MQALNTSNLNVGSVRCLSMEEIALIGGADGWSDVGMAFTAMAGSFMVVSGTTMVIPGGQPAGLITGAIAATAYAVGYTCNALSSD